MVKLVWCKLCAKHKILLNLLCKGSAEAAVEAYVNGTNFVKKSNIHCQLSKSFSVQNNWYDTVSSQNFFILRRFLSLDEVISVRVPNNIIGFIIKTMKKYVVCL